MKNLSLALNAVLIVAVAILYFLHFSNNSNTEETTEETVVEEIQPVEEKVEKIESKIGYLNVDSLQKKYKLYSDLINKLKAREAKYEKELTARSSAFEKKVMEFQKNAPTMTQFEGQTKQKELAKEEQDIYDMRDDFALKFQNEEAKLNDEFQKKVKDFIKKFNLETDYNIIIGSSQLGNVVLDYNEGINITNEIVTGLNEQYDKDKAPKVK